MTYNEILNKFSIQSEKNKVQVKCPAHDDGQASLTISKGSQGKTVLHCHAGCQNVDILSKVGLEIKDLFDSDFQDKRSSQTLEDEYIYTDENGDKKHFSKKFRLPNTKKRFLQGHYENHKEVYGLEGVITYPYNLPAVLRGIVDKKTIYIVEGEKDAKNLISNGLIATTNPSGAGKWKKEFNKYFKDAEIIIFPDNDTPGASHANDVYKNLNSIASSVMICELPDLPPKGDVSDYLQNHTFAELMQFVDSEKQKATERKEKLKNKVKEIRDDNDFNFRDIVEVQEQIYDAKGRVIAFELLNILHEKYNIKTSVIQGKRKYFFYKAGCWNEIDKDSLGLYFFYYLREEDRRARFISEVINIINSDYRFVVDESVWDSKNHLVNLKNCTFDLVANKPLPHSPNFYFTYKTSYDYNPDAKCPEFDKSLREYSKTRGIADEYWIKRFYEIAGYAMYGEMPLQKMFWFTGSSGRNGKGTAIRMIERLVGIKFTISDIDTRDIREKFYKTRLIKKRLATAGDLHHRLANISSLKQLTGGDMQMTDVKFGDAVAFVNNAKFIFAMNQVPTIPDGESIKPIAKRIVCLQFNHEISNPDSDIENKFNAELSGIFNKAVQGFQDLFKKREFTPVKNADKWLANWAEKKPPLQEFLSRYEYDSTAKGLWLIDVWREYCKTMVEFYGSKWEFEQNLQVKGIRKLKEKLIEDIATRYKETVKSEFVYSKTHSGTYAWVWNVKDSFVGGIDNLELREKDFSEIKSNEIPQASEEETRFWDKNGNANF